MQYSRKRVACSGFIIATWINVIVGVATLILFAVFLGTAHTDRNEMREVQARFKAEFAPNQLDVTVQQFVTTVADTQLIAAKAKAILEHVDPESVSSALSGVGALLDFKNHPENFDMMMQRVEAGMRAVIGLNTLVQIQQTVDRAHLIAAAVDSQRVSSILTNTDTILSEVEYDKLIGHAKNITLNMEILSERLASLHSINF